MPDNDVTFKVGWEETTGLDITNAQQAFKELTADVNKSDKAYTQLLKESSKLDKSFEKIKSDLRAIEDSKPLTPEFSAAQKEVDRFSNKFDTALEKLDYWYTRLQIAEESNDPAGIKAATIGINRWIVSANAALTEGSKWETKLKELTLAGKQYADVSTVPKYQIASKELDLLLQQYSSLNAQAAELPRIVQATTDSVTQVAEAAEQITFTDWRDSLEGASSPQEKLASFQEQLLEIGNTATEVSGEYKYFVESTGQAPEGESLESYQIALQDIVTPLRAVQLQLTRTIDGLENLENELPTEEYYEFCDQLDVSVRTFREISSVVKEVYGFFGETPPNWLDSFAPAGAVQRVKSTEEQLINLERAISLVKLKLDTVPDVSEAFTDEDRTNFIEKCTAQLQQLEEEYRNLKEAAAVSGEVILPEAAQKIPEIASLSQHLAELNARKREIEKEGISAGNAEEYEQIKTEIIGVKAAIKEWEKATKDAINQNSAFVDSNESVHKSFLTVTSSGLKFSDVLRSMKNGSGLFSKAMKSIERTNNKFIRSLKHGFTNITKYIFGFRSLFFLIRRLRKTVIEGVQNLVQFDSANNVTNKAITELKASLLYLKNAWGAAVAPILNVVLPILSQLLDMIAAVGNAIARLIATLTGQSRVIQAVKTGVQDYAESLDKSAGSSGKAAKAADKLKDRLAAFDDLNVLGKDDETDPSSSGGGGGGGDTGLENINDMFEYMDVVPDTSLLDMIKKSWLTGDFTELGTLVGVKIQEGLNAIPWDSIQATFSNSGRSLGTFLTGLLGDPALFTSAGHTIAEALNTITYAVQGFFEGYDVDLGSNVAEGIRSFLVDTDWSTMGENFSTALKTLIKDATDFALNFPTDEMVQAISDFAAGIDWGGLSNDISTLTVALVRLLGTLGGKLMIQASDGVTNFIDSASNDDWVTKVEKWGYIAIMAAVVTDSIDNFVNNIKALMVTLYRAIMWPIDTLRTTLLSGLLAIVAVVRGQLTNMKIVISGALQLISDVWHGDWDAVRQDFEDIWTLLKSNITSIINDIIGVFNGWLSNIIGGFNRLIDALNSFGIEFTDPFSGEVKRVGFNLSHLTAPQIPYLAQGAVIPANKQFLAVLGDQKHGTNIEAPLDTIVDAFRQVVGNLNVQTSGSTVMQVDGQTFARLMTPYVVSELHRRGYDVSIMEA